MANPENGREEAPEAISPHYDIRLPKLPWHRRVANSNYRRGGL